MCVRDFRNFKQKSCFRTKDSLTAARATCPAHKRNKDYIKVALILGSAEVLIKVGNPRQTPTLPNVD